MGRFGYRCSCWLLRCRGRHRWSLAIVGGFLAILVTVLFMVVGLAMPDPENARNTGLLWGIMIGFAQLFLGVMGNLVANGLQKRLDAFPRDATTALHKHHLAGLVGDSVRVLLLVLVDRKPGTGNTVTAGAKKPLERMAAAAPSFWRERVDALSADQRERYDELLEPQLSKFIVDPQARALDNEAWEKLLVDLYDVVRRQDRELSPPFSSNSDKLFTIEILGAEFGRSFCESLKWDFTHGGLGWAAMQLEVSRQLLQQVTPKGEVNATLKQALVDLTNATRASVANVQSAIDELAAVERARHRAIRARLDEMGESLDQILARLGEISAAVGRIESTQQNLVAPQLAPLPVADRENERNRFLFRSQRLSMVGRDAELKELYSWLDRDDAFGWDLWTGPAGCGKSRLALQLCLDRNKTGWKTGFYRWTNGHQPAWHLWMPTQSWLIVFDYVAEHADVIGEAIVTLASRSAVGSSEPLPQGIKVRFLLLERGLPPEGTNLATDGDPSKRESLLGLNFEVPWLGTLRVKGDVMPREFCATHARNNVAVPQRSLGGVPVDAARAIIREEAQLAGNVLSENAINDHLSFASRIDPLLRPLFVAMAAEAIRDRGASFEFDEAGDQFDALVNYIRDKEWRHAAQRLREHPTSPVTDVEPWRRLAVVATMCGGLWHSNDGSQNESTLAHALKADAKFGLPLLTDWRDGTRYSLIASGAGRTFAPPLEPDVLGEAFVLDWLAQNLFGRNDLIDLAWKFGMDAFVVRAAQNFPDRIYSSGLLARTQTANPDVLYAAHEAWAIRKKSRGDVAALVKRGKELLVGEENQPQLRALGGLMWMQGQSSLDDLDLLLEMTRTFDAGDLENANVRKLLAMGLVNAVNKARSDTERANALLVELRELANTHSEAAMRDALGKGLVNAVSNAGSDTQRADSLLVELRQLADQHKEAADREPLAKGLFSAFNNARTDTERADRLLGELRQLARNHDELAVRVELAKGLVNAISIAGSDTGRADGLLGELRQLAPKHDDPAVREKLAEGLVNAITNSGRNTERADTLLGELRQLARNHDEPAVRENLAKGLFNALVYASSDTDRTDTLLGELRQLARNHDEPALRENLAQGLFNALVYASSDTDGTDTLLGEMRQLARNHDEPAVRALLAHGLVNAIGTASDTGRTDALLGELRGLTIGQEEPRFREALAKGLFNAFNNARTDRERADRLLGQLRQLAVDHDEAANRELLAKGLFNAFVNAQTDTERADGLLGELRQLALRHNGPAVREALAKGLVIAISNAGSVMPRAEPLLNELRQLAVDHPDEAWVVAISQ